MEINTNILLTTRFVHELYDIDFHKLVSIRDDVKFLSKTINVQSNI